MLIHVIRSNLPDFFQNYVISNFQVQSLSSAHSCFFSYSCFLQVEITLQDINDNPPVFPTDMLDLTVEENIGDGSKILQLTAMDADEVGA